ncbi:MAG: xanthine dehydrogenase family protein subunit M [Spirochaetes bacterium]|nr:xanthine dehydrogenase family protein subunit M [Spirochaetota bacterium]
MFENKREKNTQNQTAQDMEYLFAQSVGHAVHLVGDALDGGMRAAYIAGGTDIAVGIAEGTVSPHLLVDITGIGKLRGIDDIDGEIWIGAATPLMEIACSRRLPNCLVQGAAGIGSVQIRNLGTVGGNICNASPCGDTLAPLLALDAEFVLFSPEGDRSVGAKDFFRAPKQTVLKRAELLVQIVLKEEALSGHSAFRMIGKRNGQAISQVNCAVWLKREPLEGRIVDIRVAFGSVAPTPIRLKGVETLLRDKNPDRTLVEEAKKLVREEIRPISDVRASESYRSIVAKSLFEDALAEAMGT